MKNREIVPIYRLQIARKLLSMGETIHDIRINNNGSGNLMFLFHRTDTIKKVLKDEYGIEII